MQYTKFNASSIDSVEKIIQHPLDVKHFAKLPIGGNVTITPMRKWTTDLLKKISLTSQATCKAALQMRPIRIESRRRA